MVCDFVFEVREIFYSVVVECCVEGGWCAVDRARLCGKVGFGPGAEASIEDVDMLDAKGAECPPCAWGREDALLFVDDDGAVVADAEGRHAAGEVLGSGEHMGEWSDVVGEFFDVEEEGTGDVLVEVTGAGVDGWDDAYRREGGVEDDCGGILKAAGQPCGGD